MSSHETTIQHGNVFVELNENRKTWDINWTHEDPSAYVLESIALRFRAGSSGMYVIVTENVNNVWNYRLQKQQGATSGTTYTFPLNKAAWQGKTSGTLRALFYKYSESSRCLYYSTELVFTYRSKADPSTVTVIRTMAGMPQTAMISNTDPDVYHKVTWDYGSWQQDQITSGELTFTAGNRNPSWSIPSESMEYLYRQFTNTAEAQGTVTVKTYTSDGTYVGVATATAWLDLPETAETRPVIQFMSDSDILDATAEAIYEVTDNPYVQNHTTLVRTVTAQGYAGADIAGIQLVTPDGTAVAANSADVSMLIRTAGSYPVEIRIIDTRGQVTTWNDGTYTVQDYMDPTITSIQALRSDDQGNEKPDGDHAWVEAAGVVTGSTETYTAKIRKKNGSQIGAEVTLVNGVAILPSTGTLSEDESYVITVTLEDEYGVRGTAEIELGTGTITISRMAGGKGLAFGQMAEKHGVEITREWPFYVHGSEILRLILDTVYPPGTALSNVDPDFNPNEQWPWTRWGQVGSEWVRGV